MAANFELFKDANENEKTSWINLRKFVTEEKQKAKTQRTWWVPTNIVLGVLSALTAAAAGVGALRNSHPMIVGGLALASAAVSALMILMKPAERADEATKTLQALDDLEADLDLFEIIGHSKDIVDAEIEARNRVREAKNRPRPRPLVATEPQLSNANGTGGLPPGRESRTDGTALTEQGAKLVDPPLN